MILNSANPASLKFLELVFNNKASVFLVVSGFKPKTLNCLQNKRNLP